MSAQPPAAAMLPGDRANARNALIAGFLGWTLDAFDFFILTYVLGQVGAEFHKSIPEMTLTLTASLVMRPVGAVLFGLLADRYGRRLPLIVNVLCYSAIEMLSGLAPSYLHFSLCGCSMASPWAANGEWALPW